jgi:ComF family protein
MSLVRMADQFLITLFDATCVACAGPLTPDRRGPVCAACWRQIPHVPAPLCGRCGEPLTWSVEPGASCGPCVAEPPAFDGARAAGLYTGSLKAIVHALKYGRQPLIAPELGRRMRTVADDWLTDACVVPVPLHPWRSWQRGFNQAELLARELGPPVRRLLWRRRLGRPQAGLPAHERRHNVADVYRARRTWRRVPSRVVLVDDVLTTGATVDACARVLKAQGVREVLVLTAARAARQVSRGSTAASTAARTSSLPSSPSMSTQSGLAAACRR